MKVLINTSVALFAIASTYAGTENAKSPIEVPPAEKEPSFLGDTKVFLNGRLRYEYGDTEGLNSADAITLRNRFGIETGTLAGFSFLAEGEHTLDIGGTYAPFPGFNNGRTVIADPDNLQLNRLQLSYTDETFGKVIVGRQGINLGDQRFVGTVGWRQNDQTFDAASLTVDAIPHLALSYTYVDQVNRIFGTNAPAKGLEEWDSDSHLINVTTDIIPGAKLTGFAYLLGFSNAAAFSSNTYGFDLSNTDPIDYGATKLGYYLSSAYQTDGDNNPANYDAWYFRAEGNAAVGLVNFALGGELLSSDDGNAAFQTPLGTNHKFNGFADAFLITPAGGLRDYYVSVGATCPLGINHKLFYHYFQSDNSGSHLGNEIDYVATKQLNEHFSITGKVAYLAGANTTPDTFRGIIQLDYAF